MKLTPLFVLCGTLALTGCSALKTPQQVAVEPLPAPVYVAGELNRESLFELLSAELAGQNGMLPDALSGYMRQAELTGDAAVAERATRVAQFMRRPDSILRAAQLWQKAAPDNAEPYQIEASILIHQGKFTEALPLLQQALHSNLPQTLGLIESRISQMPADVLEAYRVLLDEQRVLMPMRPELYRSSGILLRRQGKLDQALQAFNQALQLDPDRLDVLVQKADLLRTTGQTQQALQTAQHGLSIAADNRQLRLLSIQLQFDADQVESATADALDMVADSRNDYPLHLYLALLMMDAEQLDTAEQVLTDLLDNNPSDSTPEFYLGHLAQKRGHQADAIAHFLSVNGGEKLYPAFSRVAALLDSAEHQQRFQQIINDGRALYPHIAQQLFALEAEWLHLYDLTDTAVAVLEDALKAFPDDVTLLYTRAMLVEGSNFPQAEQDLRQVLAQEPNHAMALNALGYLLTIHTERLEEARQMISKALLLNPNDPATLDSMGWVLYRMQRPHEALAYLEKAHELLQDPEIIGHLVEVYHAVGQTQRSRKLLEKSLTQFPDEQVLQAMAEKLGLPMPAHTTVEPSGTEADLNQATADEAASQEATAEAQ